MKRIVSIILFVFLGNYTNAQKTDIDSIFKNPPQSAKPWVFWYWLHGAVSKGGITADLESMKEAGIGGAYLMPIKDTNSRIPFQPQVRQLSSEWWSMVKFALLEAKRLKLEIGVHVSDGFALAGGPWIKPEMSMQKLVWTKTFVTASRTANINLPKPESNAGYYKDIAVYAYPANYTNEIAVKNLKPAVTTSNGADGSFLANDRTENQTYRSDSACWLQYTYTEPITIRQVKIKKQNNAYQSQRFIIQQSSDGITFMPVDTLQAPRHGWQDWDEPYTHSVKTFTTKYIRFVWQKEGTEPGSEDLDAAKWKPALRVQGIYVSDEPVINNYEAKNGSVWRVAAKTNTDELNNKHAVPLRSILDLTKYLRTDGTLGWRPPSNRNYVIVRIGHTSTGAVNSTAGGGKGLECDKFSTEATALQFKNWFGKFYTETDEVIAKEVIKVFHVDSWECGSQNWSSNFATEFKKRRGYDILPYLIVMTGTPVTDAATSEKVLRHVRETIAELVNEKFYGTLKNLAHKKGVQFSAESIAPTFVSDGLMHYKYADIPMGEFWLNSPTHDKPNDMLDAISGAHIYGKNIVQAEAFTTLRSDWSEHPGSLKALGDRAFTSGINKLALHVMMHNPWMDKKPGMTLDGIGLFYQRDQTWFKQSKAWVEYLTRCQALLQLGKPVVDIGVFTGEEIPRRSVLPDRLITTLPGLFGKEKADAEKRRLLNEGQPQRTIPDGVTHSANMADPERYINAFNGYQYDCFNPDVLMQMKVVNGRVVTPGGASYAVLVIPGMHPMNPNGVISEKVKGKLKQLAGAGAKIIISGDYIKSIGDGKGIFNAPYWESSFEKLGLKRDVEILNARNKIAWVHRQTDSADIYFLSNQSNEKIETTVHFRVKDKMIEIPSFDDGKIYWYFDVEGISPVNTHRVLLQPYESKFFVFRKPIMTGSFIAPAGDMEETIMLNKNWKLKFEGKDPVALSKLTSWHKMNDSSMKYYSGTAFYTSTFELNQSQSKSGIRIKFDFIYNLATVKVNGINCGTLWTKPYELDISKAVKQGVNTIEIDVTNTWRNRLIYDELNPEQRQTWFNSPYKLKDKPLLPAGIMGEVKLLIR